MWTRLASDTVGPSQVFGKAQYQKLTLLGSTARLWIRLSSRASALKAICSAMLSRRDAKGRPFVCPYAHDSVGLIYMPGGLLARQGVTRRASERAGDAEAQRVRQAIPPSDGNGPTSPSHRQGKIHGMT